MTDPEILIQVGYGLIYLTADLAVLVNLWQRFTPPDERYSVKTGRVLAWYVLLLGPLVVLCILLGPGPQQSVVLGISLVLGVVSGVQIARRRKNRVAS